MKKLRGRNDPFSFQALTIETLDRVNAPVVAPKPVNFSWSKELWGLEDNKKTWKLETWQDKQKKVVGGIYVK